jgi:hypothetical protein
MAYPETRGNPEPNLAQIQKKVANGSPVGTKPATAVLAPSTVRCCNCDAEITPEIQSPEMGVCAVCLIYRQDCEAEQLRQERQVQVTREMTTW